MKKNRWIAGLILGMSLSVGGALTASATTLEPMNFSDMVSTASACVIADVVNVKSERRNGEIVTLTTFKVRKTAFGKVGNEITVVTPGGNGTMGRLQVSEVVAGAPRFLNNQDSLMLLNATDTANEYAIVGLNQGLFNVAEGANGVNLIAFPESIGGKVSEDDAIDIILEQRFSTSPQGINE